MPTVVYDAIVVGLGGVGSFALRSLARKQPNLKVLGLERFHIGHELGSSHGATRLFRHAYFEHPSYVPLCLRSTETFRELSEWKQSQESSAIPLLETCGVLVVSDGGKSGTYEVIERCAESANLFGIPTTTMETEDLRREYGSCFAIPVDNNNNNNTNLKGLLEPGAGFVRPELAIRYAIEDAVSHGAEIEEGVVVVGMERQEESPSIYCIETSDGRIYRTKGVIVSAGAWASKLLPELDPYLKVTRQIQAWFELPSTFKLPPVGWFLDRAQDPLPFYGIPADPLSEHPKRSKVAIHGRNIEFDPDVLENSEENNQTQFKRPQVTQEELDELKDIVRDWIPGAAEGIVDAKACLYTMTPDEHFVVDRKKEQAHATSNIWYAAGLSGHGFKMTPALGQALADLVIEGTTDLPVDFLTRDRFKAQPTKAI